VTFIRMVQITFVRMKSTCITMYYYKRINQAESNFDDAMLVDEISRPLSKKW